MPDSLFPVTVRLLDLLEVLLYWRLATALAGQTRCAWHPSERARLYHVLHLRDLLKKKEGIHVLGRRNGGCSATRLTAGAGGPSNG